MLRGKIMSHIPSPINHQDMKKFCTMGQKYQYHNWHYKCYCIQYVAIIMFSTQNATTNLLRNTRLIKYIYITILYNLNTKWEMSRSVYLSSILNLFPYFWTSVFISYQATNNAIRVLFTWKSQAAYSQSLELWFIKLRSWCLFSHKDVCKTLLNLIDGWH